ncbi:homeodomain-like protein [Tanacetum coccineum]|uniref:Homeodomain-like protein n=1 Tax=Tanacetum coccineum TaxID=301880 RepID=A0ABQ4XK56_9ASTR
MIGFSALFGATARELILLVLKSSIRTRRSNERTVTPFANPERQFRARREVLPPPNHNIYSFYESESSESDTEDVDIETLTLEQYLDLELNNTRKSFAHPKNSTFEVKGQLLRELQKISFSGGPTDNAVEHISIILEVASIFNAQESTLIQVFPITLEGIAKRWFERTSTESHCSPTLQNKLPPKETDPRSFILPCMIGNHPLSNALADLGASICIMPYSLFKRLEHGSLKPIKMAIKMADRSIQSPRGAYVGYFDDHLSPERASKDIISLSASELTEIKENFGTALYDTDKRMSMGLDEFVDIDDM